MVWGSPTDPASFPSDAFDVVYDNNGKDLEACQPLIDAFKVRPMLPHLSQAKSCKQTTVTTHNWMKRKALFKDSVRSMQPNMHHWQVTKMALTKLLLPLKGLQDVCSCLGRTFLLLCRRVGSQPKG